MSLLKRRTEAAVTEITEHSFFCYLLTAQASRLFLTTIEQCETGSWTFNARHSPRSAAGEAASCHTWLL